jgi:hypothetical protein
MNHRLNMAGTIKIYSSRLRILFGPIILSLLAAVLVTACIADHSGGGSNSSASSTPNSTPSGANPTAVYTPASQGTASGAPVSHTIDAVSGGTVTSSDSRLDVSIPPGALAEATPITIQPITNTGPNGAGFAYRLGPEGTTFAAPVTLIFHFSDVEALALDSSLVATQYADGLWYVLPGLTRDATANTVSVTTIHFSDYAVLQTLFLQPARQRVKVDQTADFVPWVIPCDPNYDPTCDGDLLTAPRGGQPEVPVPNTVTLAPGVLKNMTGHTWSLNSIAGGDSIAILVSDQSLAGRYHAPSAVPDPNTVDILFTLIFGPTKLTAYAQAEIFDGQ